MWYKKKCLKAFYGFHSFTKQQTGRGSLLTDKPTADKSWSSGLGVEWPVNNLPL
jgi:hypothetical protein